MRRRSAQALVGAAAVGGILSWPRDDRGASELHPEAGLHTFLRGMALLPAGMIGALKGIYSSTASRPPMFERTVRDAVTGANVHLCGVSHVDPAAAIAVRARANALAADERGFLAGIAVEADPPTLSVMRAARGALAGLPAEAVRVEGASRVRRALFESSAVHTMAAEAGRPLRDHEHVGLSPTLVKHLETEAVLWGLEQAEAAESACALGVELVCLRRPLPSQLPTAASADGRVGNAGGQVPGWLTRAAFWLRCQALRPGFDPLSTDEAHVAASNQALREIAPRIFSRSVDAVDAEMAAATRAFCERLAAAERRGGVVQGAEVEAASRADVCALLSRPPVTVMAVVGARHVHGMERRLAAGVG